MKRSGPVLFATVMAFAPGLWAQTPPSSTPDAAREESRDLLAFEPYLREVGRGNLDLAAARAAVSVAQAGIAVARVFPDPQVTAGILQYDVTRRGNPTATLVSVDVPLEIGGQRGARVAFAEANFSASQAELLEFLRGLRASAANAYIDALHARLVLERRQRTLQSLLGLVAVNQERFRAGDIGESGVIQSRVEANEFRAQVLDAEGSVRAADIAVVSLLGSGAPAHMGHGLRLSGDLRVAAERHFTLAELLKGALARRPDLLAARRRLVAADRQIGLASANRTVGVSVGATWQHNFEVTRPAAVPSSDFLGATVTVPLPFSHVYRGELDVAYGTQRQARASARSTEIQVEAEVREAVARYEAAAARVRLYTSGVLTDADQVLEKTLYNYRRGGATLVEVLVAQRTDNDVYLSYYDSLADAAHALVAVEQASGVWDVAF